MMSYTGPKADHRCSFPFWKIPASDSSIFRTFDSYRVMSWKNVYTLKAAYERVQPLVINVDLNDMMNSGSCKHITYMNLKFVNNMNVTGFLFQV